MIRDPYVRAAARWHREGCDSTLRLDYPLGPDSVVLDVGGYEGAWAEAIADRYDCYVHVFEPVPAFHERIARRLHGRPKVRVHPFGLAAEDGVAPCAVAADGSSLHRAVGPTIDVPLRDVVDFVAEAGLERIDLVKINIEGGEFALLRRMLDAGLVERCRDLQVQFHTFVPDAVRRREALRAELRRTHELTYDYPFVWENWRRRADGAGAGAARGAGSRLVAQH